MRTKSLNLYSHLVTQLNKVLFCGGFCYTSYKLLRMDISNLQVQIVQTMIGQYTPAKRGELKLHSFYKDAEQLNHYQFLIMSIEQLALNRVTIYYES